MFRKNSVLPPIDVVTKKNYSKSAYASTAAATMNNNNNNNKGDEEETKALASLSSSWDVLGLQSLVPEWKNMFNKDTVYTDISAGLTVGCVAIPLSLAIALASGVPAEVGLVTAVVSGVAGGLLGGTTLAVTGPAAAISLLVIGAVEQHGLEALPVITLGCGMLQVVSGMSKLGVVAKLCPVSVIAGFTTGVGTLILTNQLPKALGMTAPSGLNPLELLVFIGDHAAQHINPSAAALAIGTSAAMFALPKLHPKMPSALVAVGGATVATHALGLDVSLIGTIPSGLDAFQFGIPTVPPVEAFPSLAASTFLIYAMTSVESLLSCASLEKMKKTTYKHCPDQELIGQYVNNIIWPTVLYTTHSACISIIFLILSIVLLNSIYIHLCFFFSFDNIIAQGCCQFRIGNVHGYAGNIRYCTFGIECTDECPDTLTGINPIGICFYFSRVHVLDDSDDPHARIEWCTYYDRDVDVNTDRIQTLLRCTKIRYYTLFGNNRWHDFIRISGRDRYRLYDRTWYEPVSNIRTNRHERIYNESIPIGTITSAITVIIKDDFR